MPLTRKLSAKLVLVYFTEPRLTFPSISLISLTNLKTFPLLDNFLAFFFFFVLPNSALSLYTSRQGGLCYGISTYTYLASSLVKVSVCI